MVAAGKGSIINIASVTSHIPLSRVVSYSASKAAVLSLSQFLAREWATNWRARQHHHAGFFPAEQNKKLLYNDDGTPTERAAQILGHTPMDRFGECRRAIRCSGLPWPRTAASSFVTGTDIRVDGGFLSQPSI